MRTGLDCTRRNAWLEDTVGEIGFYTFMAWLVSLVLMQLLTSQKKRHLNSHRWLDASCEAITPHNLELVDSTMMHRYTSDPSYDVGSSQRAFIRICLVLICDVTLIK